MPATLLGNPVQGGVSAMALSHLVPGCLVTGTEESEVKIWDIYNDRPSMVASRKTDSVCSDQPLVFI